MGENAETYLAIVLAFLVLWLTMDNETIAKHEKQLKCARSVLSELEAGCSAGLGCARTFLSLDSDILSVC